VREALRDEYEITVKEDNGEFEPDRPLAPRRPKGLSSGLAAEAERSGGSFDTRAKGGRKATGRAT
jgi:hypothetical protein